MSGDAADGFLSRWSRRKRAAGLDPVVAPVETGPPVPDPRDEVAAAPAFDPASLPAPETLTATSDITGFLRAEVPAALRRVALRRIWTLDPGIRDFIGPADYAWDYNAPDGVPGFALGLGGDVQKLLAQAMGWQPGAEAGGTPAVHRVAVEEPPAPERVAPDAGVAIPPAPAENQAEMVAGPGLVEVPGPAMPASPAEAAAPVAARRHGSAVPS